MSPVILYSLLSCVAVARSAFIFEFEIVDHHTNGNCAGMDFTIPCETFVNNFCLRGPGFVGGTNTDINNCPLGINTNRVFDVVPQKRTIQSNQTWPSTFQLFIGAYDDDYPATTFDFLDDIFIDSSRSVTSQLSAKETFRGVKNKVGVDIRFRVTCQSNYYSTDCSVFCLARNDSSGHYTCDPVNGSRVCNDGFEHPETNCVDKITACSSSPCQNGSCTPIGFTDFTCDCPPGYTGRLCETEINECDSNPCLNGTCEDLLADYSCACVPGYTGKDCDIDIDECLQAVCVENAHCIHGINSYECVCNLGFEGSNCTEIDPCDISPCAVTGLCHSEGPFHYNCSCDPGYTGPTCEDDIDDCPTADCPLNSDCVDGVDSYMCVCHSGFTGENCTEIPPVVGDTPSSGVITGGIVGALAVLSLFILIAVVIVTSYVRRSGSKREYNIPGTLNSPLIENSQSHSNSHQNLREPYSYSGSENIANPVYETITTHTSQPNPIPHNTQDTDSISSLEIANPGYHTTLRNDPEHVINSEPIYSEIVEPNSTMTRNYSYSYVMIN